MARLGLIQSPDQVVDGILRRVYRGKIFIIDGHAIHNEQRRIISIDGFILDPDLCCPAVPPELSPVHWQPVLPAPPPGSFLRIYWTSSALSIGWNTPGRQLAELPPL